MDDRQNTRVRLLKVAESIPDAPAAVLELCAEVRTMLEEIQDQQFRIRNFVAGLRSIAKTAGSLADE